MQVISKDAVLSLLDLDKVSFRRELEEMPTFEFNPEPQGYWMNKFGMWECSECGEQQMVHTTYCPCCGAKLKI